MNIKYPLGVLVVLLLPLLGLAHGGSNPSVVDDIALQLPSPGDNTLHILTPTLLDLVMINTETSGTGSPVTCWNFVSSTGTLSLPANSEFNVQVNGQPVNVLSSGFKRRPLYAPLAVRDLRIENHLYLVIDTPIADNSAVTVTNPDATVWPSAMIFSATSAPLRYSPAIHVNQEGYTTMLPKKAMVGYYLGSMAELSIPLSTTFSIVNVATGQSVFQGSLTPRPDVGYVYSPLPYQQVYQADFSAYTTPGQYQLEIPGMGASLPFRIDDSLVMGYARAYEQGIYNQRSGVSVSLPFSRFTHPPDHTAPAFIPIPQASFPNAWIDLTSNNGAYPEYSVETAPRMVSPDTCLYPFVNTGTVDVSGGHHDAGDYSKYTIDSCQMIHYLIFAVDSIPGAATLDNLGIPESGDGISDLMQEAKNEADFLAKMQDADGGFYFLVYPKDRKYESNVLPQNGDPQVVFPKNTAGTAAAVAALAEMASSPTFKAQYPAVAAQYLQQATAGWAFLMNAINTYGKDGSYQQITSYGDVFMHNDELAWAACAMFLATGNPTYQQTLISWYNPSDPNTRRWTWWRLFESYGCTCRDFAFAVQSGRLQLSQLDPTFLAECNAEIIAAGNDALTRSQSCAYGSAYDSQSKRFETAGWYFSSERAFDMTVAYQLNPNPAYIDSVMTNLNFEGGCNPDNVMYITGLGYKRQHDIVNQYAQNDKRQLPPSGIPIGNILSGFAWLNNYGADLGALTFPSDGLTTGPFPFYDRWGDSFNTTSEAITVNAARALASLSFFAAQTPAASQAWVPPSNGTISTPPGYTPVGIPVTATLTIPGMDLSTARIVWETGGQYPAFSGTSWTFTPASVGSQWLEAEAAWPDGRRVSVATIFQTCANTGRTPFTLDANTIALYHFDTGYTDSSSNNFTLTPAGHATLTGDNIGWMMNPSGQIIRFSALGDTASVTIPWSTIFPNAQPAPLTLEAMVYPRAYKAYSFGNYPVLSLYQNYDATLEVIDGKWDSPACPFIYSGPTTIVTSAQWSAAMTPNTWHLVRMTLGTDGTTSFYVDGNLVTTSKAAFNFGRKTNWTLSIGNFDGDMDELRVSNVIRQ